MSQPVREDVERFAALMEMRLTANDHKGGWQSMPAHELLQLLRDEIDELEEALDQGDPEEIISECGDVGNFAMMLADVTAINWGK